jgi:acyl-CoA synthetase (AMP-forming)/AMP-acid ligase II/alpha-ketoglutarate-dependent taurine dioxygenase
LWFKFNFSAKEGNWHVEQAHDRVANDQSGPSIMGIFEVEELQIRAQPAPQEALARAIALHHRTRGSSPVLTAPARTPLTYSQLAGFFNDTGTRLNQFGFARTSRVGVAVPNGPEAALCVLAVMQTAVCVPLNPDHRRQEFEDYISRLALDGMIVPAGMALPARVAAARSDVPVIDLVSSTSRPAGLFDLAGPEKLCAAQGSPAADNDPALILCTSGTTGRPKVVVLRHRNLTAAAASIGEILRLGESDCSLIVMPLFHIHGLSAVFATLLTGGTVACPNQFDPDEFYHWLEELRPTWYTAAPTIHQAIVDLSADHREVIKRSRLRFVRSASSAMPTRLIRDIEQTFGVPFLEAYGMTEAAPQIASNPLPPQHRKAGTVGLPAGAEVAIVDLAGKFVAAGVRGEVVARGPNVITEYANEPAGQSDSFMNGWLRTGDEGYLDSDGYLAITGRFKEQINRGGEKISPREVEEVLDSHPAVKKAVCFGVSHPRLGEDVAAAVELNPGTSVGERDLQDFARMVLTEFKVPRQIMFVPEIPKTSGGKVKRADLARQFSLSLATRHSANRDSRPQTLGEQSLVSLWREVLGATEVGIHDDFTELGGDSLLAGRLLARIRDTLGVRLTHLDLAESPTIAELSARLDFSATAADASHESVIVPGACGPQPPLSFSQEALWFANQLHAGNPVYNNYRVVRLRGRLDIDALQDSLAEVATRHTVLRSFFVEEDGRLIQRVAPAAGRSLVQRDLSTGDERFREQRALESALFDIARPIDISVGPPFRATLFSLGEIDGVEESWLVLVAHHIVSDAWSMSLWISELGVLYGAAGSGTARELPGLPVQYGDFAHWQRNRLEGNRLARLVDYWVHQLAGAPEVIDLPTDEPRPHETRFCGARHYVTVPGEIAQKTRNLARQQGTTLFVALLAAFKALLYRRTGCTDIVVGTHVAGRDRPEIEALIGDFTNTLPLRSDLSGDPDFRELLRRVRRTTAESLAHQDLPFATLLASVRPARRPGRSPLFQVRFRLQSVPLPAIDFRGLAGALVELDYGFIKAELGLELAERPDGLGGFVEYRTDLFHAATIVRLWDEYLELLGAMVARPDSRLSDFSKVSRMSELDHPVGQSVPTAPQTGAPQASLSAPAPVASLDPRAFRRQAVSMSSASIIRTGRLAPDQTLPLVIEPAGGSVNLVEWSRANSITVENHLKENGALLFRGFGINSAAQFEEFLSGVSGELLNYTYRSTPRRNVTERVYTSTEYPANETIPQHNEMSYSQEWPRIIGFCCLKAAAGGGQTPLSDSRRVYARLPGAIRERFEQNGVMYVRNYGAGFDLKWEDVFQTTDQTQVAEACRGAGIEFEWLPHGHLRTRQIVQAVIRHPQSGDPVWFNQAHLFHVSSLKPEVRNALLAEFGEDGLPRNAFYGDGGRIEDGPLDEIRRILEEESVDFTWHEGDVVLLDNLSIAHGRRPFTGTRQVLVGMAQQCRLDQAGMGVTLVKA